MEIANWERDNSSSYGGCMIRVSPKEANQIIQSLSSQILSGSPNVDRTEFYAKTADSKETKYFSIAVHPDEKRKTN